MKRSAVDSQDLIADSEFIAKVPRTQYAHAFKLLATDALAAAILGARGAGIQEIQALTESKISLADRSDKYHLTNLRLVLIKANSLNSIDGALQAICLKLKSLIDSPNPKKNAGEIDFSDILDKKGEFKLKCVMPRGAAAALIGFKGANIAELREATGCKVRVEEEKIGSGAVSEQVISLIGALDSIMACLQRLNAIVQELSTQDFFQSWAHLRQKGAIPGAGGAPGGIRSNVPQHVGGSGKGGGAVSVGLQPLGGGAQNDALVQQAMCSMTPTLVNGRTFAVQASLPIDCMSALIGKGGQNTKDITAQTGAKVTLRDADPNTVVTIEGPLNSVLSGYCLVMKKYLELESSGHATGGPTKGSGKGRQ